MTALKMKQSSLELINQIDEQNTELLERVWLFLSTNVSQKEQILRKQSRQAKVEALAGAFAVCQTDDWKKEKEQYVTEKYGREDKGLY